MKKKILLLLSLILVVSLIAGTFAFAYPQEAKAEDDNHIHADGCLHEIYFEANDELTKLHAEFDAFRNNPNAIMIRDDETFTLTIEIWPDNIAATSSGCSAGNHTNVITMGSQKVLQHSSASHPTYCQLVTTTSWRCTACTTIGSEKTYSYHWCPSPTFKFD
ncbi:MAG: hypothetical protein FWG36_10900 [Oscillospiraceae bacterium]|nr:hypothetical protein [Oscillospiraceae bacterium]